MKYFKSSYLIKLTLLATSLLALGCGDDATATFSILADQVPGGVFLSVASDGDEAILVGGQLDGGKGILARYKDGKLCVEEAASDRALWWIHSARPGEWYAVGEAGTIIHSLNGVRTDESVETKAILYGVWDAGDRVIAVGGDLRGTGLGEVWIRESGTWEKLDGDLPGVAFKVWGQWIVGKEIAYHLEGNTLVERFPPANTNLLTVVGRSDDDVWAVGGTSAPTLLHWEDKAWKNIEINPFCTNQGLNGVWTAPGEELWIAGFFGSMGSFSDGEWTCPKEAPTYEHFHAVARHGNELIWAGGNMFDLGNNYGTVGRFSTETGKIKATVCP